MEVDWMGSDTIDKVMDFLVPVHVGKSTVERSHLKYTHENGSTKFYGFHIDLSNVIVAVQESGWYFAFFKPFYNRILQFEKFGSEEKLAEIFASRPTISKLEKSMPRPMEFRDEEGYIEAFKKYYGISD